MIEGRIIMPLHIYDTIQEENRSRSIENTELRRVLTEMQRDNTRVIVVKKEVYLDTDGEVVDTDTHYETQAFDDVREVVEKHFNTKMRELEEINALMSERIDKMAMRLSEMKNRSLWKRIMNK